MGTVLRLTPHSSPVHHCHNTRCTTAMGDEVKEKKKSKKSKKKAEEEPPAPEPEPEPVAAAPEPEPEPEPVASAADEPAADWMTEAAAAPTEGAAEEFPV